MAKAPSRTFPVWAAPTSTAWQPDESPRFRLVRCIAVRDRPHGWRMGVFRAGQYLFYYRETETCWLVAGVFRARRDSDWI